MAEIIIAGSISTAQVVIIGLVLVFALLLLITGILFLLPKVIGLFTKKKNKATQAPADVQAAEDTDTQTDDGELAAVIAAAIAQAEADSDGSGRKSSFRVVSFRRVGKH